MRYLLSLRGVATRAGIAYGTVNRYYTEKRLPEPDFEVGDGENDPKARPAWLPGTIDQWIASRPGQGARTDLATGPQS